jgi:CheY-like chemotaxis protein
MNILGQAGGRRLEILLVDNENDGLLFELAVTKSALGLRLHMVADGLEAIDYLEGRGDYAKREVHPLPNLLMLALRSPRMTGLEFLAWRRGKPWLSLLPVIIFSGSTDPKEIESALDLGANTYISKPHDWEGWLGAARQVWELGLTYSANLVLPHQTNWGRIGESGTGA